MTEQVILIKPVFRVHALLAGQRIDIRMLENIDRLASSPLTVAVRNCGVAVIFRYGAVVFFDAGAMEQADFLNMLSPMIQQPCSNPESESIDICIDPEGREEMKGGTVVLTECDLERVQLIADILGKSVALAQHENELKKSFARIEPFAENLEQKSRIGRHAKELLRHIGSALLSEHRMVSRVEIGDKPDLIWERPDLERFFLRLEDEFEIKERHQALERKLNLITRTAETVHDLLQERRVLRVEWYIVILIVVEIVIMLYEMIAGGH